MATETTAHTTNAAIEFAAERQLTAELYGRPFSGSRRDDLGTARELFERLGSPQNAARSVHVAGTAGKGSVVAYISAILAAHDFTVGSYSSPHAYALNERIRMDTVPVPHRELLATFEKIAPDVDSLTRTTAPPTFFETLTAMAFAYFAEARTDYNVVETGIGGLHDCTNTIDRPDKLAVITQIGLDHTELLGPTARHIARHKAGIFPPGGVAIAIDQCSSVLDVLADEARIRQCHLHVVSARSGSGSGQGHGGAREVADLDTLTLRGEHQKINAALALNATRYLAQRDRWTFDQDSAIAGVEKVVLPGRFERRHINGQLVVLDGAHNPMKLAALVAALRSEYPDERFVWILAFVHGKDVRAAIDVIAPHAVAIIATGWRATLENGHPGIPCVSPTVVVDFARERGVSATGCVDVQEAIDIAGTHGARAVVAGSFHLLSEIGSTALTPPRAAALIQRHP